MASSENKQYNFYYFAFFIILTISKAITLDRNKLIFILLTFLAGIHLIIKILNNKYTVKEFIIIVALILLGGINLLFSKKTTVLISIIAIVFAKNISFDKLIRIVFNVRVISFISVITWSLLGIVENVKSYRILESGEILTRYSLGFSHPNTTYLNFFILILLYLYIYFDKLKWINYFVIIILAQLMYMITDSRTGYIIVVLSIIMTIMLKNNKLINNNIIKIIIQITPIICGLVSILGGKLYDSSNMIFKIVDDLLSGRLQLSNRFLNNYNIKPFGQRIIEGSDINGSYLRIDNGYISLFLAYGFVIFIMYIIFQTLILRKYINEFRYKEILLIIIFSLYGLTEVYIYNVFINISLLFMSDLLYCRNRRELRYKA